MSATSLNLASILEHQARLRPEVEAIVFDQIRIPYATLHGMVGHLANGLKSLSYGPGDHIALCCPNLPFFPIAYYAILRIGGVVVPLNVLMKPREIAYHLNDSDATGLLVFEGTPELPLAQLAAEALTEAPQCRHLIVMTRNPQAIEHEGQKTLASVMAGQSPVCPTHPTRADDTAVMLYTSGTTGQAKGAELTHSNMVLNAMLSRDLQLTFFDFTPGARNVLLATLPLFHSYGQTVLMNAGLFSGSTVVLLPRFEPAAVLETMVREKVNIWAGVPTMFWSLLDHAERHQAPVHEIARHLKVATSGGAAIPVEVLTSFEKVFGVRVLEGFGLSETSPVATFNQVGRPSKPGTVGLPMPYCDVAVVDDNDHPVATGELGEVVIRGHNIMKGYYKRPEATADALRNGWFHSGDIGRLDSDGYLTIVDRKKDMIIRGGFNVYPRELEELLMTHPAVSLCAVVGIADARLGEEIKAVVVRKPGVSISEAELQEWCKEQFASYKYPRVIEFRDALPLGPTGKILKRELR